jgi:hypothetical protein
VVSFLLAFSQNPTCIPLLPMSATFPIDRILLDLIILIILYPVKVKVKGQDVPVLN